MSARLELIKPHVPELVQRGRDMVGANILRVEVGTNCPCGGDGGHGGRTVLRLFDVGGTSWSVTVNGDMHCGSPDGIEIEFKGDSEAVTLLAALEYAARILRALLLVNDVCEQVPPLAWRPAHDRTR